MIEDYKVDYISDFVLVIEKNGYIEYELGEKTSFYDVGYNVMENYKDSFLIKCHRIKFNGKNRLVYVTDGLISLKEIILDSSPRSKNGICSKLTTELDELENNGFIDTRSMITDVDKIFVDRSTGIIKFIYLPILLESDVKSDIKNIINCVRDLVDIDHSIIENLSDDKITHVEPGLYEQKQKISDSITLKCTNGNFQFVIENDLFIIGKNSEKCNGVIPNPAVSRIHCKIVKEGNEFYISDMGSANGTYVNGVKSFPNQLVKLSNNDALKIANVEFIVC